MAGPAEYSEELANEFCSRVAEGRTVTSVCKDEDMPWQSRIYSWVRMYPEFALKLEEAREQRSEAFAEEVRELASTVMTKQIQPDRVRVAVYALEKAHQMMKPKTTRIELTGANGKPVEHDHKVKIAADVESFTSAIAGLASRAEEDTGD